MKKIRVLIVDDSLLFRESLSKRLKEFDFIEIVGVAGDPYEAKDKIIELKPDVITLDVEMPRMNGIKFLKKLLPTYAVPVIVISSLKESVFEAMNAGAFDFVGKPQAGEDPSEFIREVATKIKGASTTKFAFRKGTPNINLSPEGIKGSVNPRNLIAIGASTGGTEAIYSMLTKFSDNMPGIVIVQHMPAGFTKLYAERLNKACQLTVSEAKSGDEVKPGHVLIAPGDYNMKVYPKGTGYMVKCDQTEKTNGHRPSVDVLFNSVAQNVGSNAIGIILTGMGADGARGLLAMREAGGYTIGQDEKSSVVYGMPQAAYTAGAVMQQAPLFRIPDDILRQFSML